MVLLKSMQCPVLVLCSATADISGWSRPMCLLCSLQLASMDLPVWPTYTLPPSSLEFGTRQGHSNLGHPWQPEHLYGLLPWNVNCPDVEFCQEPTNFIGLTFVVWKSGYPNRFLSFNFLFCFGCRALLIWSLLYPFRWNMHFRWWISPRDSCFYMKLSI
jgi:hypothetical protein